MSTKKKKIDTLAQVTCDMKEIISKYWTASGAFAVPKGAWDPYGKGKNRNPLIAYVQRAIRVIKSLPPADREAAVKELFGFLYEHDPKENRPHVPAMFLGDVERDLLRSLEELAQSDPALAVSIYRDWNRHVRLDMDYITGRHADPHRLFRALRGAAGSADSKGEAVDAGVAAANKDAAVAVSSALVNSLRHGNSVRLVEDLTRHAEVVGVVHGGAAGAAFRRSTARRLQCLGEYDAAAQLSPGALRRKRRRPAQVHLDGDRPGAGQARPLATVSQLAEFAGSEADRKNKEARMKLNGRIGKILMRSNVARRRLDGRADVFEVWGAIEHLVHKNEIRRDRVPEALAKLGLPSSSCPPEERGASQSSKSEVAGQSPKPTT